MTIRRFAHTCAALLVLVGGVGQMHAQDEASSGPATQIWANLTLGKTFRGERLVYAKWSTVGP